MINGKSEIIVHCNLKENAELIAKILDADLDNEVYEKTGEWIVHNIPPAYGGASYKCTNCTAKYDEIENKRYCPFCGAFMNYRTNDNCRKCNHYVNDGRHIGCGSWNCSFEGKVEGKG